MTIKPFFIGLVLLTLFGCASSSNHTVFNDYNDEDDIETPDSLLLESRKTDSKEESKNRKRDVEETDADINKRDLLVEETSSKTKNNQGVETKSPTDDKGVGKPNKETESKDQSLEVDDPLLDEIDDK